MSLKSDQWIKRMALGQRMIDPFVETQISAGGISYGLASYGYDFRIANQFRYLANSEALRGTILDPVSIDPTRFTDCMEEHFVLKAGSFVLGRSLEYFRIPREILAICTGKSTYARCGILVNVTPLEPEWEGHLTVSIANTGPAPVRLHANAGIGQLLFLQADGACHISYKDKRGKYQNQQSITLSKGQPN